MFHMCAIFGSTRSARCLCTRLQKSLHLTNKTPRFLQVFGTTNWSVHCTICRRRERRRRIGGGRSSKRLLQRPHLHIHLQRMRIVRQYYTFCPFFIGPIEPIIYRLLRTTPPLCVLNFASSKSREMGVLSPAQRYCCSVGLFIEI